MIFYRKKISKNRIFFKKSKKSKDSKFPQIISLSHTQVLNQRKFQTDVQKHQHITNGGLRTSAGLTLQQESCLHIASTFTTYIFWVMPQIA
jgi:hypothetical protein